MKKIFLLAGIALFAFSCSSDNEKEPLPPEPEPKPLTQYEVDYKISNEEMDSYPQNEKLKRRAFVLEKQNGMKLGNLGVLYYCTSSSAVLHLAYDACCPIHWEDSDPLKHKLEIEISGYWIYAVCNVDGFRSSFDLYDGKSLNSYASEHNIQLVKYNVEQYPKDGYPDYPAAEGRHITNPKYKEK